MVNRKRIGDSHWVYETPLRSFTMAVLPSHLQGSAKSTQLFRPPKSCEKWETNMPIFMDNVDIEPVGRAVVRGIRITDASLVKPGDRVMLRYVENDVIKRPCGTVTREQLPNHLRSSLTDSPLKIQFDFGMDAVYVPSSRLFLIK